MFKVTVPFDAGSRSLYQHGPCVLITNICPFESPPTSVLLVTRGGGRAYLPLQQRPPHSLLSHFIGKEYKENVCRGTKESVDAFRPDRSGNA